MTDLYGVLSSTDKEYRERLGHCPICGADRLCISTRSTMIGCASCESTFQEEVLIAHGFSGRPGGDVNVISHLVAYETFLQNKSEGKMKEQCNTCRFFTCCSRGVNEKYYDRDCRDFEEATRRERELQDEVTELRDMIAEART